MVIECLSPIEYKSKLIIDFASKWEEEIRIKKMSLGSESVDLADLEAFEREIIFRKEKSISSRIRSFVEITLSKAGNPDAKAKAKRILEIYHIRSKISHGIEVPSTEINDAMNDAKEIVKLVLRAILLN